MLVRRWTVHDRDGRPVYLTEERWQHIIIRHDELTEHFEAVLDTIRFSRRRQDPLNPEAYHYYRYYSSLSNDYVGIEVIVLFKIDVFDNEITPNNFVVTAWGIKEFA